MSQEYTPVDWVDETTSQQGTLINAARLTQMQTAHHYADGFEEVDAIPTEDPGVDYHKVVYCTADATFYRWDGTQWTADIDEDTKHLLDQEIARATQAEGVLRADIIAEATAREDADTALGQRIDGLGADTLPMTHGTSTPTIQNAVAANAGNISNLANEVDGLEASKADKADTLAGYGITDAVATSGAQTVGGVKTFTDNPLVSNGEPAITIKNTEVSVSGTPASTEGATIHFAGSDGEDLARIKMTKGSSGMTILRAYIQGPHDSSEVHLISDSLGSYMTGPARAYDPANASDIMTIGVFKAQTDTLLATKADVTALADGSVTKVGTADLGTDTKPIKLVAGVPTAVTDDLATQTYVGAALDGYAPMVRTTGNQDIAGVKTFTSEIKGTLCYRWYTSTGTNMGKWMKVASMPSNMLRFEGRISTRYEMIEFTGSSADLFISTTGVSIDAEQHLRVVVENDGTFTLWLQLISNYQAYYLVDIHAYRYGSQLNVTITTDPNMYDTPTAGASYYNSQAMPALVHRTGAETIEGVKTFNSAGFTEVVVRSNRTSGNIGGLTYKDGNDNAVGQIYGRADGSISINLLGTSKYMEIPNQRAYNASNTGDVATIGTLDQYAPMVRTSGNQEIGGEKTFISSVVHKYPYPNIRNIISDIDITTLSTEQQDRGNINWDDKNGVRVGQLRFNILANGRTMIQAAVRNSNGTMKYVVLAQGDTI